MSVFGAIFTNRVGDEMKHRLGAAASSGAGNLASAQLDHASLLKLPAPVREAYQYAVSSGTHGTFLVGSIVAVALFVMALFVKEVPLPRGAAPTPAKDQGDAPLAEPAL